MLDLTHELREIARALEAAGATYALAGGLAVSIYATPRATQDIDSAGRGFAMTGDDVAARLSTVSALRALCLRLPHLATPSETERLQRFDALVEAPERATDRDVDALVAGWSRWWREGRARELGEMARRLDARLVDADRHLASFAVACRPDASR